MENPGLIRRPKEALTRTALTWFSLLLFVSLTVVSYNLEQELSTWGFPGVASDRRETWISALQFRTVAKLEL